MNWRDKYQLPPKLINLHRQTRAHWIMFFCKAITEARCQKPPELDDVPSANELLPARKRLELTKGRTARVERKKPLKSLDGL